MIWQIISFILPPNAWTTLGNIATLLFTILPKKNHLFRWSSFWSWRVCKQAKLSHPATVHSKADAPKTSHCLVRILVQRHNWASFLRKWARPCWMNFCSQKLKRMTLPTFGVNRTALCATQPKLYSMFCALFFKIALSAAELMSFDHLGTAIWHRWTIICRVLSKISVTPASRRKLTL